MKRTTAKCGDQCFQVAVDASGGVIVDESRQPVRFSPMDNDLCRLEMGGRTYVILCKAISESDYEIWIGNHILHVTLEDDRSRILSRLRKASVGGVRAIVVRAPMPGLITSLEVAAGDTVTVGKGLLVLEAMKMENEIRAVISGKVRQIEVVTRQAVEKDQQLMIIDPLDE